MIDRTTLLIDQLAEYHHREHERRYARRNRLRFLDALLNQFEELNINEVTVPSRRLAHTVYRLAGEDEHPLLTHPLQELTISQWQDTLYDLQDPLLLYTPEPDDEPPA
jgi:hypothetical protein